MIGRCFGIVRHAVLMSHQTDYIIKREDFHFLGFLSCQLSRLYQKRREVHLLGFFHTNALGSTAPLPACVVIPCGPALSLT